MSGEDIRGLMGPGPAETTADALAVECRGTGATGQGGGLLGAAQLGVQEVSNPVAEEVEG